MKVYHFFACTDGCQKRTKDWKKKKMKQVLFHTNPHLGDDHFSDFYTGSLESSASPVSRPPPVLKPAAKKPAAPPMSCTLTQGGQI
jgi:hypothetical protein